MKNRTLEELTEIFRSKKPVKFSLKRRRSRQSLRRAAWFKKVVGDPRERV
jgi:hypothetical protein